jgi:hypothetical protein
MLPTDSFQRTLVKAALYVLVVTAVGTVATKAADKACDKIGI